MKNNKIQIWLLMGFLFLFYFVTSLEAIDYPLEIDVMAISFNYDPNSYSQDALSIKENGSSQIIVTEWELDTNLPIAYIKGQSNRKIRVTFRHNQNQSQYFNFHIGGFVAEGDFFGNLPFLWVSFPSNNNGISEDKIFQLIGSVPNSVGKRYVKFGWFCLSYSSPIVFTGKHEYYTLVSSPKAPMEAPWITVLDHACSWANGQTTTSGSAENIVHGLYNNCNFLYDNKHASPRYTNGTDGAFNLTNMLLEIGSDNVLVNCYDMGKSVVIFSNAIGCDAIYKTFSGFGIPNCIKPIGRDWTNDPLKSNGVVGEDDDRGDFANHGFGTLDANIYDACFMVDTDDNPDFGPPFTETWITGWSWNDYILKVIDDNPPSQPYGLSSYNFEVY